MRIGEFCIRPYVVSSDLFATFVRGLGEIFGFFECSVLKVYYFVAQFLFVRLHAFIL